MILATKRTHFRVIFRYYESCHDIFSPSKDVSDFWWKQPTVEYRRLKIGSDNLWSKRPNYVSMMKTTKLGKRKAITLTGRTFIWKSFGSRAERRSECTVVMHVLRTQHAQCCSTCVNYQALQLMLACTVARLSSTWNTFSSDQGLFGRSRQQNHAKTTQKQITAT